MIVYLYVDARPVERNNPPRVRGNVVSACLLPLDLGWAAFETHVLVAADLPDDDALVLRLNAMQAAGQDAVEHWPYRVIETVEGPEGPTERMVECCSPDRRVVL